MKPDREAILAMVKEVGIVTARNTEHMTIQGLEAFFSLAYAAGQQDEREACALLFEEPYKTYDYKWVVDAIRARKDGE